MVATRYEPAESSQERSRGSRSTGITVRSCRRQLSGICVIDCPRDLIDPGAPAARDDVGFAEEQMAVLPQADFRPLDPIQLFQALFQFFRQRLQAGPVGFLRPFIHQIGDRVGYVGRAVVQDVERHQSGGYRIRPPITQTNAEDAKSGGRSRHPVGFHHLGVGEQDLVVNPWSQRELRPAEKKRGYASIDQRQEHWPACPDGLAEQRHAADRRPLVGDQLYRRFDQQQRTHGQQRQGRGQITDGNRGVEPVGIARTRQPARRSSSRAGKRSAPC